MAMAMAMRAGRIFRYNTWAACMGTTNDRMYALRCRWASKKAGGSTKNGRDSESKRLGVKKFGGYAFFFCHVSRRLVDVVSQWLIRRESVVAGNIIIRQRGTKYHVGTGVGIGRDHTIFAKRDGFVRFWYNKPKKRQEVSVKSHREVQRAVFIGFFEMLAFRGHPTGYGLWRHFFFHPQLLLRYLQRFNQLFHAGQVAILVSRGKE
ncbi:hypothetical protein PsorP6_015618 [Peronosclerospora sorghi]|uniref:Uncharacterized protein n=1 Tax=Peronosclerospora sorghi TaxID=230839 RepID=A0ACC0WN66_9STRA|nr:hypothetical protein PsorP6_015618 [Peronosclerospora sorghi]